MMFRVLTRSFRAHRLGGAAIVAAGAIGYHKMTHTKQDETAKPSLPSLLSTATCSELPSNRYAIADAVEKAAPAVVNITIDANQSVWTPFGRVMAHRMSAGSGFIIDSKNGTATIVTNAHVVSGEDSDGVSVAEVKITLPDEREYKGTVTHYDRSSDVALVSVSCPNEVLPTVQLGDSGKLRAGEWIVVIGSPLTLANSITAGVVSNVRRKISDLGGLGLQKGMQYIQTDAAINEGNSGGPICNLDGEVVGIANCKAAGLGIDGISFAIPINFAKKVIDQLRSNGYIKKPYIGVQLLSLEPAIIPYIQNKHKVPLPADLKHGVLVAKLQLQKEGPAASAGLKKYDVIVKAANIPIRNAEDFVSVLADRLGEGPIQVEVIRGKDGEHVSVSLEAQEAEQVPVAKI